MQEIEIWKPIRGLSGYKISSYGNVTGRFPKGRAYRCPKSHKGYLVLRVPHLSFSMSVHRLVAKHFIKFNGDREKFQINHIDGNKLNNHYSNLEYVTCKENINHAIKLGLRKIDANLRNNDMFDRAQVLAIRDACKAGFDNHSIAKYFNCNHSTISKIKVGKHYPNVV